MKIRFHISSLRIILLFGVVTAFIACDKDPAPPEDPTKSGPIIATIYASIEDIKMNEIQTIGSHNSYRLKTYKPIFDLVTSGTPPPGLNPLEWDYTHEALSTQFSTHRVRSIELDIHHDPAGGLYWNREGNKWVGDTTASFIDELLDPGMKVLHIPDLDYNTNNFTFKDALSAVKSWSDANPTHLPLIVMVELKTYQINIPGFAIVLPFTASALDSVDMEIESVFGMMLSNIITPEILKGTYASVNEAVLAGAWPTLAEARGKIFIVAMASSGEKASYMQSYPGMIGRSMFMFSDVGSAETAFIIKNNPVSDQDTIHELVQAGYMVRTRADVGTWEARNGDYSRMNLAMSSGAQIISTDYYRPDPRADTSSSWTNYSVNFPNFVTAILNPINGPTKFEGLTITE
ncbi:MAG: hypothetical protein COB85_05570 [Bacteroidetes bacterium]|nr:MAG: hypothetical protein COB85_05570 [Bacteroidota bacterium]